MTKVYSILFFYLMLNASYADIVGKTYIDYGDARTMGRVGTYNAENNQWDTTGKESTITTAINAIKNKIGSGLDETNTIGDALSPKAGITADSNSAIITDNNGKMTGGQINSAKIEDKAVTSSNIATQSITNADIANNAAIDMDKLKLPNKDHCAGKLCMLIYKGGVNQFVWEPIADVTNEAVTLYADYKFGGTGYGFKNGQGESYNCDTCNEQEWFVWYDYGKIEGIANCSKTPGKNSFQIWYDDWKSVNIINYEELEPSGTGENCWCGLKNFDGHKIDNPEYAFFGDLGFAPVTMMLKFGWCGYNCARCCANNCAHYMNNHAGFREALYNANGIKNSAE